MLTHLPGPFGKPKLSLKLWNCWIVVERSKMMFISIHIIANQNSYHDDKSAYQCFTLIFCPRLIRNVRGLRRIDSSSIIAHPVNFYIQWERLLIQSSAAITRFLGSPRNRSRYSGHRVIAAGAAMDVFWLVFKQRGSWAILGNFSFVG